MVSQKVEEIARYQAESQKLQSELADATRRLKESTEGEEKKNQQLAEAINRLQAELLEWKAKAQSHTAKQPAKIEDLQETIETLREDLTAKSEYIRLLNEQIAKLRLQTLPQKQSASEHEELVNKVATLEEAVNAKEMIIRTLQGEFEVQVAQMEKLEVAVEALKSENTELRNGNGSGNGQTASTQVAELYYPVKEVRQKTRTLANLRFIKNRFNEYGLEKYTLKERTVYPLVTIEVVPHRKAEDCIVVRHKSKPEEVFETEYAKNIVELYLKHAQSK